MGANTNNKAVKSASPYIEYSPDKFSANELMGVKAGKTQYQFNSPAGIYALATLGTGPGAREALAQDAGSQYDTQKKLRALKPGYEQQAEAEGGMAQQGAISSGLGGGGVQSAAGSQAYNRVLAQYAALRQAMEAQRVAQQMQMYGSLAQVAAAFYAPGAGGAAPTAAGTGGNIFSGMIGGGVR